MLSRLGIDNTIFPKAIPLLKAYSKHANGLVRLIDNYKAEQLLYQLKTYDIIILSDTITTFVNVELLSLVKSLNKPFLFYEVFSLSGCLYWIDRLPSGSLSCFDEYLVVSGIHDTQPIQTEKIHVVGADISPLCTFAPLREQYTALMDFPREGFEVQRQIQLNALSKLKIHTIDLDREYTFSQIEEVYRRSDLYFVAFPEAFGIPIVQLQNYGCHIAAPETHWVKRHALIPDGSVFSYTDSSFNGNFLIYRNEDELIDMIQLAKNESRYVVKARQLHDFPHYTSGRLDVLWDVLRKYS